MRGDDQQLQPGMFSYVSLEDRVPQDHPLRANFVDTVGEPRATPHVMQNNTNRRSTIDERTTRRSGHRVSLSKRWLVEKPFAWMKQIGGLRKVKLRGLAKVQWLFAFGCAAYNLLRIPKQRGQAESA
jgi:IS5 family transposase